MLLYICTVLSISFQLVGKQHDLMKVLTQVEDFSDPGTFGFGFPAGKTLHFFGCHAA